MAPLLSPLFLKLNSSLKPLLKIQHLMILGLLLPHLHPLTTLCLILKFFVMTFSMPCMALTLGGLMVLMEFLLLFSATVLLCLHLVKLFRFCLLTSTFISCRKLAYIQPTKGDRSNPSNYRPRALLNVLQTLMFPENRPPWVKARINCLQVVGNTSCIT